VKPKCTVHIVDDEAAIRAAIAFLLMNEGYAVCVYDRGQAFLDAAIDGRNACLVTDLRMPDVDGIELLRRLNRSGVKMPAIVITGHGDVATAVSAMKAGAADFIEKPFEDSALIAAIEKATARAADTRGSAVDDASVREHLASLTSRERDVLAGVLDGLANKVIAYDLNISPRTVEIYRASLMAKMQTKNLAELLRLLIPLREKIPWLAHTRPSSPP